MENAKVIPYPLLQEFAKAIVEAMKREDKIIHDSQQGDKDNEIAA